MAKTQCYIECFSIKLVHVGHIGAKLGELANWLHHLADDLSQNGIALVLLF